MRCFRSAVRRSRWLMMLVILSMFSYSVEANNFAGSYRASADEEAWLEEMTKPLGVPVEKLHREQPGLVDALKGLFTNEEGEARQAGMARVEAQLKKMTEQVEANPYRPQIVKNTYQSHRLDGLLRDLTKLSTTDVRSLPVASRTALLRSVRKALEEDLEPYVPDNLPAKVSQSARVTAGTKDLTSGNKATVVQQAILDVIGRLTINAVGICSIAASAAIHAGTTAGNSLP